MVEELIERLSNPRLKELDVITWGSPVPTFGNLKQAKIATLGLNPSNKEFVDNEGKELIGEERRFHTLKSLSLKSWEEALPSDIASIIQLCNEYFYRNPYDNWFKRLDFLISGTSMSYYFPSSSACHLDLIPFATSTKWGDLANWQKSELLEQYGDTLGELLRQSSIKVLILNGKSVLENFQKVSNIKYDVTEMAEWTLPRRGCEGVTGLAYEGTCTSIGGVPLNDAILVLGFNHNIQSSYGITSKVQQAIRKWIASKAANYL